MHITPSTQNQQKQYASSNIRKILVFWFHKKSKKIQKDNMSISWKVNIIHIIKIIFFTLFFMVTLFYVYLFVIGSLFGSFSSVIIDRLQSNKKWIFTGRSECPKCLHKLWVKDLFPIFSYLSTGGKCRYCQQKISPLYPILELITGWLFFLIGYFMINTTQLFLWDMIEWWKLIFFLIFWFFTVVYVFYDILYLEIPESILAILLSLSFVGISLQSFFPEYALFPTLWNTDIFSMSKLILIIIAWVMMIATLYTIMLKELKEIYDVGLLLLLWLLGIGMKYFLYIDFEQSAIGSAIIGWYSVFVFFYIQILISGGKWMGWGDLRIAILLWCIAWISYSFWWLFLCYISGSIIWLWVLGVLKTRAYYKLQKSTLYKIKKLLWFKTEKIPLDTQIPFWPFLAIWCLWVLFFSHEIDLLFQFI